MLPNTMNAVYAEAYGEPNILKVRQLARPIPQANEVLVRVEATAITKADAQMRTGRPYFGRLLLGLLKPKHPVPGTCFAGEIVAIGETVEHFQVGDRVVGLTTLGFSANAEYLTIPADGVLAPLPASISFAQAAVMGDGPLTSLNFLREIGQLQPGQSVLINGASGALGTAGVQIAKNLGAEVTGVCSARNLGLVKSLGADHVIDYTKTDFTALDERYDLVYDTVGKTTFSSVSRVLKPNGQYLCPVLSFPLLLAVLSSSIVGKKRARFAATGLRPATELRELLIEIVQLYQRGNMRSIVDRQYPLERVAEAHTYIETGRKRGNVIALPQAS